MLLYRKASKKANGNVWVWADEEQQTKAATRLEAGETEGLLREHRAMVAAEGLLEKQALQITCERMSEERWWECPRPSHCGRVAPSPDSPPRRA